LLGAADESGESVEGGDINDSLKNVVVEDLENGDSGKKSKPVNNSNGSQVTTDMTPIQTSK